MSYLNKDNDKQSTIGMKDKSQTSEYITGTTDNNSDGILKIEDKLELPIVNVTPFIIDDEEIKGKETTPIEQHQTSHVKGAETVPVLDIGYVNEEWEKYLLSPDPPERGEDSLPYSQPNDVAYLTNNDLQLFTTFSNSKSENHVLDIKPLSEGQPASPRSSQMQGQASETSTISKASIDEGQANKDDLDREKGAFSKKRFFSPKRHYWRYCPCTRSFFVIASFSLILCISIGLAFIWPRLPLLQIQGARLVQVPAVTFNPSATNYFAAWDLDIATDNRNNYIPITAVVMDTFVRHSLTGIIFGRGQQHNVVLRPISQYNMTLPIDINYQAKPDDALMSQILAACGPGPKSNNTQTLQVDFGITIHIWGLSYFGYSPTITLTPPPGGFQCPYSAIE